MKRLTASAPIAALLLLAQASCSEDRLQAASGQLQVDPGVLDFGPQSSGSVSSLTLRLTNTGSARLTLSTRLERDARGAFTLQSAPASLEAGAEEALTLTYLAPQTEGADGVSLVIEADTAQRLVSVSGRSVAEAQVTDAGPTDDRPHCPGAPPTLAIPAASPLLPRLAWNGSANLLTHHATALEAQLLSQDGTISPTTRLMSRGLDGRAVFTGTGYGLLAWRWLGTDGAEVVFARLTTWGGMVPASERLLPRLRAFQTDAALAWNPLAREWGVLWHEWDNGTQVLLRFARLTEAGTLVEGSLVELGPGLIEGSGSMLVFGGGAFVALLGSADRLRLVRLDSAGNVSFTQIAEGASFHAPSVAWNGVEYGLSWVETFSGTAQVKFARAGGSGELIAGSLRTLHAFPFLEAPTASLVASGAGWLATWAGTPAGGLGEIFVARLSASGEGAPLQLTCDPARDGFPVASTGGIPTAVAFTSFGPTGSELHTALIP